MVDPPADEFAKMFSGKKKKKKSKSKEAENAPASTDPPADDFAEMFAGKKKKKKDKGKEPKEDTENDVVEENVDPVEAESALPEDDDTEEHGVRFAEEPGDNDDQIQEPSRTWLGSDRDYHYKELLDRFYFMVHGNEPSTGERKRFVMKPPQVSRVGTKRTVFSNFGEVCSLLKREQSHLLNFLLAEMGTTGSTDASDRVTFKGRFMPKQIQALLRRYIMEYVTCQMCKSPDTELVKNSTSRLYFMNCNACQSSRSVAQIRAGYKAQVGRRKKV